MMEVITESHDIDGLAGVVKGVGTGVGTHKNYEEVPVISDKSIAAELDVGK